MKIEKKFNFKYTVLGFEKIKKAKEIFLRFLVSYFKQ